MLKGRTIYIPPVDYGSARVLASAFRAGGMEAETLPPSDELTREIANRYASGDECHPFQLLAGDVMKRLEGTHVDPARIAFLLLASDGQCRFTRFVPDLHEILERSGYGRAKIFAPHHSNAYKGLEELGRKGARTAWRAMMSAGTLQKLLLLYRPFEMTKGATDKLYEDSLQDLSVTIEAAPASTAEQLKAVRFTLLHVRERFRAIKVREERSAPLIGIVGELSCRFNPFLNSNLIRQLEEHGAQAWLTPMLEEVRPYVSAVAGAGKEVDQDETALMELFSDAFAGCGEADFAKMTQYTRPYLPVGSGFGQVALRLGQIVHMAKHSVDGVIDASPFPCMNGSACAAFYPRLSRDLDGLPIRTFYYTDAKRDWSAAIDDYLGLVRSYRERREKERN
jgi:predicted nucleotide-binding protein (sugar kinase/HSP70/actin superfamily)